MSTDLLTMFKVIGRIKLIIIKFNETQSFGCSSVVPYLSFKA